MNGKIMSEETEKIIKVTPEETEKSINTNQESATFLVVGDQAYTSEMLEEYNRNAEAKTEEFNTNAENKIASYNSNAADRTTAFDNNYDDKITTFDSNVNTQIEEFDAHVLMRTNTFNNNAASAIADYNLNAEQKIDEFNQNVLTLPIASETTLGGIKVGNNLTIDADGTLNALSSSNNGGISEETDPVFSASASASITNEDISNWNNKSEFDGAYSSLTGTPTIPTKTSELTNDSSFASESYVTNAIANAQLGGGDAEIDLSGYATKDELNTKVDKVTGKSLIADTEIERLSSVTNYDDTEIKNTLNGKANISDIPTNVSQLTNDSGYLTSVPSEYVTETELNNKGYLTEHQDISNLATKSELHSHNNKTILDNILQTDIDNWNNKSEFSGSYNDLTDKPTIPSVPTNVSSFTNDAGYLTSIPSEYVTETELNDAISGLGSGTGNVSSDVINSIVVVDKLPTVEETGVLYLIKDTGTSTEPETPNDTEVTNLYYQSEQKDYESSSSGYNISWTTDGNVLFNSTSEMTKEREQSSGDFTLDLFEGKTYKLKATYVSGEMSSSSGTPYYHIYLKDSTTSTKYCELSLSNGQDTEETFTATTTETLTSARMYVYVYIGTQYTNLVYNITLTEVA